MDVHAQARRLLWQHATRPSNRASWGAARVHPAGNRAGASGSVGRHPALLRVAGSCVNTTLAREKPVVRASRDPKGRSMNQLLIQYLPIAIFLGVALLIGAALLVAPFLFAVRNPDPEKVSAYECGFNAFDDARMKFDVRFYLVAILFIIFDLEIAFLFPWAVAFREIGALGFWSMMIFLGVLTVGFIYEWKKGALEWD
jgi:NADH-quinone oxidoreductase subunit A